MIHAMNLSLELYQIFSCCYIFNIYSIYGGELLNPIQDGGGADSAPPQEVFLK